MGNNNFLLAVIVVIVLVAIGALGGAMYYRQDCVALKAQLDELAGKASGEKHSETMARPQLTVASSRPATSGDSEELQSLNAYIDKLESENASLKQQLEQALQRGESMDRRSARRERNIRVSAWRSFGRPTPRSMSAFSNACPRCVPRWRSASKR